VSLHLLEPVLEHRTVDLFEQVDGDLDAVVRRDTHHVLVVGGVVDLAERETVGHCGDSAIIGVREDVRGVEQRPVLESAHRALRLVGEQDPRPEDRLLRGARRRPASRPHKAGVGGGVIQTPQVQSDRRYALRVPVRQPRSLRTVPQEEDRPVTDR
jgi:hypothetical protein